MSNYTDHGRGCECKDCATVKYSPPVLKHGDDSTPEHEHSWVWDEDYDATNGLSCDFTWFVSSKSGKTKRIVGCREHIDMDEIMKIVRCSKSDDRQPVTEEALTELLRSEGPMSVEAASSRFSNGRTTNTTGEFMEIVWRLFEKKKIQFSKYKLRLAATEES